MSGIYQPEEDSYFMVNVLKQKLASLSESNKNMKILEMGPGSGIILETLKSTGIKNENIFSADINPKSVERCKKIGFNCIQSDLFENVKGSFNIIIFNPPYLPEDKKEPQDSRLATTGGKKGGELINNFLEQSKKHLEKDGKIFLLISSLTKGINFEGFNKKLLGEKKIFMETLSILELTKL